MTGDPSARTDRASTEAMPSREELQALLKDYNEHPDRRDAVLAEIDERFRRRVAVLVLDTCGFSRTVRGHGIVHFLALLERMERLIRPCVDAARGRILRREADNLFAVFDDPNDVRAHGRDERIPVKSFYDALEFWYRMMQAFTT